MNFQAHFKARARLIGEVAHLSTNNIRQRLVMHGSSWETKIQIRQQYNSSIIILFIIITQLLLTLNTLFKRKYNNIKICTLIDLRLLYNSGQNLLTYHKARPCIEVHSFKNTRA